MGSAFDHSPSITVPSSSTNNRIVTWNGSTGKNFNNTALVEIAAGVVTGITSLSVDNIQILDNAIVSTNSNGNIGLTPNGSGAVVISKLQVTSSGAQNGYVLTSTDGNGNVAWEEAGGGAITALSGNAAQRIPFFDSTTTTQLNGDADLKFDGLRILMGSPSTPDALIHMEHASQTNFLKMRSTATNGKNWTLQSRTDGLFRITQDNSPGFTALEIHGTKGQITKPKQSCGLVRVVSDINNQTGNESSSAYQVPFSSAQTSCFDQNGDWSNSANTFYAPVTGRYLWNVKISFKDNLSTASTDIWVALTSDHDGGATYTIWHWPGRPDGIGTGNSFTVGGSIVVELDAGEYINCKARVNGEGANDVQIEGGGSFASYLSWCLLA